MKKISIVEDEKIIALDIKKTLIKFGYDVNGVYGSAESLLKAIDDNLPDLILMDIQLGEGISGIQAAAIVSAKYDIPIIFVTAYADKKTVEEAIRNHPFAYIVKPFTDDTLFTTVSVVLSRAEIEKQLKNERLRFQKLTDLLPLIVFEIDRETKFTFLNAFGKKHLKLNDLTADLIPFVKEKNAFEKFLSKIKNTKKSNQIQLTLEIEKKTVPVLFIVDIKYNHEGVFDGYRGVALDFSDMQKLQNQIIELEKLSAVSSVVSKFKTELTRYLTQSIQVIDDILNDERHKVDLEFIKNNMINAQKITDNLELFEIDNRDETFIVNDVVLDISRTFVYILKDSSVKFSCNCDHSLGKIVFNEKILKTSIFLLCNYAIETISDKDTIILQTKQNEKTKILITLRTHKKIYEEIVISPTVQMVKNLLSYKDATFKTVQKGKDITLEIVIP